MGNVESTTTTAQPANAAAEQQQQRQSEVLAEEDDEPTWWQAIEHENLVLEQQPMEMAAKPSEKQLQKEQKHEEREQQQEQEQAVPRDLEQFKAELAEKRAARQTAVQDMRDELDTLRQQLTAERAENRRLRGEKLQQGEDSAMEQQQPVLDEDDENPSSRSRHANIELANAQLALQLANADNLSLRSEVDVVQRQVGTLKEVICCCKQMLSVKEEQCAQLKMKLQQIENSFSEREMKIMSNNLRQEYERQLVNIRQLRQLYEERQRVAAAEYENLQRLISIKKDELLAEQEKTKNYEERHQLLLGELEAANEQLAKLREECGEHKYEKRVLKEQVGAVNLLFSQLVLGNGKHNMDIDRLTKMLEENRDLLNEMTQAEGSCSGDAAMLPKLLFELVEQAAAGQEGREEKSSSNTPTPTAESEQEKQHELEEAETSADQTDAIKLERRQLQLRRRRSHEPASAQEIIGNLPKVWKVLMELLSHHKIERVQFEEMPPTTTTTTTTTPTNTTSASAAFGAAAAGVLGAATAAGGGAAKSPELSVSKTYIKLKDLIMEKKSLVKETTRLKTLNCHLDNRLNEQEKRLSAVSLELTKTWHLVGKMQRQHRQLHTQEQILRYQLQQKRRLLSELKDELEYCRRKWAMARAKNDESQELCNDWRREFARRKLEDAHHSAESGYSDSGPQSDEDSAGAVAQGEVPTAETSACRRKHLRDQFEHTRKIKRMQSSSPGRQAAAAAAAESEAGAEETEEIVLRWNSAPPTCGWRELEVEEEEEDEVSPGNMPSTSRGAVPKTTHSSRSRQRGKMQAETAGSTPEPATSPATADRIQKLEEQCKSLIQQVLETSGNRERLEVQLCQFQDEITPAQHAVPLEEFINRKRLERMTRASSAPATGSLTPREEEYTRKRSERLGRLEEESRQLLSRIRRTADRGHYLKKSLDRIRRAPSREGSFESNTEEEPKKEASPAPSAASAPAVAPPLPVASPLTVEEEAYTSRRAARLQRMEQESQQLLSQLSRNTQRGESLSNRLDTLHERHDGGNTTTSSTGSISLTVEQRLEDIERVSVSRAERLRRLEQQGNELIARLSNTSERGTAMINRIAEREANRRQAEAEEAEQLLEQLPASAVEAEATTVQQEEEATGAACSATITTTSTQLAAVQHCTGAISKTANPNPLQHKTKPLAQLCAAARHVDASRKRTKSEQEQEKGREQQQLESDSLENMVQRLRAIPYPEEGDQTEEGETNEQEQPLQCPEEVEESKAQSAEKPSEPEQTEQQSQEVKEEHCDQAQVEQPQEVEGQQSEPKQSEKVKEKLSETE